MPAETIFLWILVLCVFAVSVVILYGIYQENQYRKGIFKQFGSNHKDVLVEDPAKQVRDGDQNLWAQDKPAAGVNSPPVAAPPPNNVASTGNDTFLFAAVAEEELTEAVNPIARTDTETAGAEEFTDYRQQAAVSESETVTAREYPAAEGYQSNEVQDYAATDVYEDEDREEEEETAAGGFHSPAFLKFKKGKKKNFSAPPPDTRAGHLPGEGRDGGTSDLNRGSFSDRMSRILPQKIKKNSYIVSLEKLQSLDLPWFNHDFDYMAYITLPEPRELQVLPRLSGKQRFRIAACNLDGQFQLAEPVPDLKYQAYVIGLQAISRAGLAAKDDLITFGNNVRDFARTLGGDCFLTDINKFYAVARPMDELCARVDQIIGLHLVSRGTVSGIELRSALERNHFVLSYDGVFHYPSAEEELFKVVNIDETSFTPSLMASGNFKGFSILFDITHVPPGSENFDTFMGLAVKLANELGLDLVDDELQELSTEWLRDIGKYVFDRQQEMKAAGITPGEELAQRLFA